MTRLLIIALLLGHCGLASAAVTLRIDEDRFLTLGIGLRVAGSLSVASDQGAGQAGALRPELVLDNALLALTGQLLPEVKVQLNVSRQPSGELRFLDAIARFEPRPWLNLWAGRMIPPVDRAALIGPLFAALWDVPWVGPSGALPGGREDGVALWGALGTPALRYWLGAFRGSPRALGRLQYVGRLGVELLQPERGYYGQGTAFGAREVLSFGVSARFQPDAVGSTAGREEIATLTLDGLLEKDLPGGWGAVTVEAALYLHHSGAPADLAYPAGTAGYLQLGYLLPSTRILTRVQLVGRVQLLAPEDGGPPRARREVGITWAPKGHQLRIGGTVLHQSGPEGRSYGGRVGVQLML